jgi:hypothetical protein
MRLWVFLTTGMNESRKIDLFPGLEVASHRKNLRIVLAIWIRKVQTNGSIGCPPDQRAVGASLVGQVRLASDVPNSVELDRFLEGPSRTAAAGAELL